MSMVQDFAAFLNKMEPMMGLRKWKGVHVDALDKLFHKGVYRGHIEFGELVLPSTLDTVTTSMLLRMWGGFRMLREIAEGRIIPRDDGALFEWPDPNEVGVATADPLPVANPEGIVPETKVETFIRRLRDDPQLPATFEIWTHPGEGIHYLSHRHRTIGTIAGEVLSLSTNCDRSIGEWLRETWRSLDAPPAIPPRVQRFLDALVEDRFWCRARRGDSVMAPFTVRHYPKEGLIELAGSGVQFGTVRGGRFSPYEQIIGEEASMLLERLWGETSNQPEMPFRVRRFLDALDRNGVRLMYDRIRPLQAPFSATISLQGALWVFATRAASGDRGEAFHKVGEIHGDTLSIDGLIAVQDRMILDYLWRETEQDAPKANP